MFFELRYHKYIFELKNLKTNSMLLTELYKKTNKNIYFTLIFYHRIRLISIGIYFLDINFMAGEIANFRL